MSEIELRVTRLPHAAGLPLPEYQSEQAAGMDLVAAVPADSPVVIEPGRYAMIPTGICIALPAGTEGQVRPRSGLAAKHGVTVLNSPGTIDADYRGEVKIMLINHGSESFTVARGTRIAQLIVARYVLSHVRIVESLDRTARGDGGFGSTGFQAEAGNQK